MVANNGKPTLKAMLYEVTRHADGSLHYRPVTSALYLTVPMIAATLGIAKQTVYRAIDEGKLKGMRFGACVRVEAEAYQEWIENARYEEYERPMKREDVNRRDRKDRRD